MRARDNSSRTPRLAGRERCAGALTRAHIAQETDDSKTALKLYHRIIDEHTYLIAEALPEIVAIYERENQLSDLEKAAQGHAAQVPGDEDTDRLHGNRQ